MEKFHKYMEQLRMEDYVGDYSDSDSEPRENLKNIKEEPDVGIRIREIDDDAETTDPGIDEDLLGDERSRNRFNPWRETPEEEEDRIWREEAEEAARAHMEGRAPRSMNHRRYWTSVNEPNIDEPMGEEPSMYPDLNDMEIPGLHNFAGQTRRRRRRQTHRTTTRPAERYIPKGWQGTYEDDILDIDCTRDVPAEIDGWCRKMGLLVNLSKDKFNAPEDIEGYLEYKMRGNVRIWWNSPEGMVYRRQLSERLNRAAPSWRSDYVAAVGIVLEEVFHGATTATNRSAHVEAENKKAVKILDEIKLCDLCLWKSFTCEYERNYYRLHPNNWETYKKKYFNKFGDDFEKKFEKKLQEELTRPVPVGHTGPLDTLGLRIRIVREFIEEECQKQKTRQKMKGFKKNSTCCNPDYVDMAGQYGCSGSRTGRRKHTTHRRRTTHGRKHYKKRRYFKYKPKYKRKSQGTPKRKGYPKYRKRKKYTRRKKYTPKASTSGKGKASCQCWLCKEEGHYANECPNKKQSQYKESNRILEVIYSMGFEPIESDVSDTESQYSIKLYKVYQYDTPSGSEWESETDTESEDESD